MLKNWAKACFELTDFKHMQLLASLQPMDTQMTLTAAISMLNLFGCQVCRVGQSFAFHYSTDGEKFYMMRFSIYQRKKLSK